MKTAIIVTNYKRLLEKIHDEILTNLPDEMKEIKKSILGGEFVHFPILNNLSNFIDYLEDDIKTLKEVSTCQTNKQNQ